MNKVETAKVLTIASGFDNRRVDDLMVAAWLELLHGYDFDTVRGAVVNHFGDPLTRNEYLTVPRLLDRLERDQRLLPSMVEVDVRSAKARGLISDDWPPREPLPVGVASRLRAAREGSRLEAERMIEA